MRRKNIPARLAVGYVYAPEYKAVGSHAWPECYLDGIGWFAVDPTMNTFWFPHFMIVKMRDGVDYEDCDIGLLKEDIEPVEIAKNSRGTPVTGIAFAFRSLFVGYFPLLRPKRKQERNIFSTFEMFNGVNMQSMKKKVFAHDCDRIDFMRNNEQCRGPKARFVSGSRPVSRARVFTLRKTRVLGVFSADKGFRLSVRLRGQDQFSDVVYNRS